MSSFCQVIILVWGQIDTTFITPKYVGTPVFDNDCGCYNDTTYQQVNDSMQIITYKDDTSKHVKKRFYKNGQLWIQNTKNSAYKETLFFHKNGKLAIKKEFENDELIGQVRKYDSLGRQVLPAFVSQKRVWNIWNQTDLKVYLLYEQTDISQLRSLDFREGVYGYGSICESITGKFIFKEGNETIIIKENGASLYEGTVYKCKKILETERIAANYDWEKRRNILSKEQTTYLTSFGKLVVDSKQPKCLDTGTNSVKIIQEDGKFLFFKDISNISFLEYDIDKDDKEELYIFSYETCMGYLKIYRITN